MPFTVCVSTEYDRDLIMPALEPLRPRARLTFGPVVGRSVTRAELLAAAAGANAVIASDESFGRGGVCRAAGAAPGGPRRHGLQLGRPGGGHPHTACW